FTKLKTEKCHWDHIPGYVRPDVLLLSDVNYEPVVFDPLFEVMISYLNSGTTILLSTPHRLQARPFIEKIIPFVKLQYEESILENGKEETISIYILRKKQSPFPH
ncbi:MAG TPA: hypothetical protein VK907_05150, partial [Phnomibacter sp.]|nr:hypothetical protein [Phnomibacter sp.]